MKVIGWLPSGGVIDVEVPTILGPDTGKQDTVPGEHIDKPMRGLLDKHDETVVAADVEDLI